MAHQVVHLSFCHHVRVSHTQSLCLACLLYLQSNDSPAKPLWPGRTQTVLPVVCPGNVHDPVLSLSASRCPSWNFLGMLSRWNLISAWALQPLPVLSLHFSYGARQPSTSLSNVTSAWHCMVLASLTSEVLWVTEVPLLINSGVFTFFWFIYLNVCHLTIEKNVGSFGIVIKYTYSLYKYNI